MKLGFIGLGAMGQPMARNLLRAGHEVTVWNRSRERAEALAGQGARVAGSPAEAAAGAEVLITMLADDRAVEEVVCGEALGALGPGAVHVAMSTISVALSRRLAQEHAAAGQQYVAAPVFGRPDAAAAAQLWIVAAGPAEALERCRPIFAALGQGTFELGADAPVAHLVKLAGNFLIISMVEALGEAFALVRKGGLEPGAFLETMNRALFKSPLYERYGRLIVEEQYEPAGFKLRLGLKDVRLALQAAEELAVPMPLASVVRDHLLTAVARGQGEIDWSGLARVVAEQAGLGARAAG